MAMTRLLVFVRLEAQVHLLLGFYFAKPSFAFFLSSTYPLDQGTRDGYYFGGDDDVSAN